SAELEAGEWQVGAMRRRGRPTAGFFVILRRYARFTQSSFQKRAEGTFAKGDRSSDYPFILPLYADRGCEGVPRQAVPVAERAEGVWPGLRGRGGDQCAGECACFQF